MQKIKEELKNQHQIVSSQEDELKIMRKRDQNTDQVSKIENFINKKDSSSKE